MPVYNACYAHKTPVTKTLGCLPLKKFKLAVVFGRLVWAGKVTSHHLMDSMCLSKSFQQLHGAPEHLHVACVLWLNKCTASL